MRILLVTIGTFWILAGPPAIARPALDSRPAAAEARQGRAKQKERADLLRRRDEQARQLKELLRTRRGHDPMVHDARRELAQTLMNLQDHKRALAQLMPVEKDLAADLAPSDRKLIEIRVSIADCLMALGKGKRAINLYRQVLDAYEDVATEDDSYLQWLRANLAVHLHGIAKFDEAGKLYHTAYKAYLRIYGKTDSHTLHAAVGYGACEIELGNGSKVEALLDNTLEAYNTYHPDDKDNIRFLRNNISVLYSKIGAHAKARKIQEELLAEIEAERPEDDSQILLLRENLAHSLAALNEIEAAIAQLEKLIKVYRKNPKKYREELKGARDFRRLLKNRPTGKPGE